MKNSSKNNYSGKSRKQNKNNSSSDFYSKNPSSSKKNNRFSIYKEKNQAVNNFNEIDSKKINFSTLKRSKSINKPNKEVSKSKDIYQKFPN